MQVLNMLNSTYKGCSLIEVNVLLELGILDCTDMLIFLPISINVLVLLTMNTVLVFE